MTKKLFGTDGIRGIANTYPMTAEVALNIGRAVAHLFKKEKHRTKIIIGKGGMPTADYKNILAPRGAVYRE